MTNDTLVGTEADINHLLSTTTIRSQSEKILTMALAGKTNFHVRPERLEKVATLVYEVTKSNYPDGKIPYHSRWRHFQAGGIDRIRLLNQALDSLSDKEKIRSKIDLVIVSVLLDAGAGNRWQFSENNGAFVVGRSEGLGVASFYMFLKGTFSSNKKNPFQSDAQGLMHLTKESLAQGFQISDDNVLVGLEGRWHLLQSLGKVLTQQQKYFGSNPARLGNMYDYFLSISRNGEIQAVEILDAIQRSLSEIWPGRLHISGFNLGDVWRYPPLGESLQGLMPFHKLSQWLSYSLVEVLEENGVRVANLDELTGLAEYRNGGLLLDSGLIQVRDERAVKKEYLPDSEIIVEWRALTIALLDRIAAEVRKKFGKSMEDFPLAKVLEGGTWWAGRKLAAQRSEDCAPPLKIISDGTVF